MKRMLRLVALLILASLPAKAQQQASQVLTITVSSAGQQQASQALTLTVRTGGPESAQATFSLTVLHSGTLTWEPGLAGANPIAGYNVFRSTTSGGAYMLLNSAPVSTLTYLDPGLASGTYYYVVAAVDTRGTQGPYSSQVTAVIPAP
jgi:hypothetical protein